MSKDIHDKKSATLLSECIKAIPDEDIKKAITMIETFKKLTPQNKCRLSTFAQGLLKGQDNRDNVVIDDTTIFLLKGEQDNV